MAWVCDEHEDCDDASDEQVCSKITLITFGVKAPSFILRRYYIRSDLHRHRVHLRQQQVRAEAVAVRSGGRLRRRQRRGRLPRQRVRRRERVFVRGRILRDEEVALRRRYGLSGRVGRKGKLSNSYNLLK